MAFPARGPGGRGAVGERHCRSGGALAAALQQAQPPIPSLSTLGSNAFFPARPMARSADLQGGLATIAGTCSGEVDALKFVV